MSKPWRGATGRFPRGMLNAEDEGQLQMAVAADREAGVVMLDFGKPVKWLGLPANEAKQLAEMLMRCARELDGTPPQR